MRKGRDKDREKAKVAVESYDDRIDPVGACVGMKGSRIKDGKIIPVCYLVTLLKCWGQEVLALM